MLCKHSYISVRVWLQFAVSLLKYGFFSTVFLLARPVAVLYIGAYLYYAYLFYLTG